MREHATRLRRKCEIEHPSSAGESPTTYLLRSVRSKDIHLTVNNDVGVRDDARPIPCSK